MSDGGYLISRTDDGLWVEGHICLNTPHPLWFILLVMHPDGIAFVSGYIQLILRQRKSTLVGGESTGCKSEILQFCGLFAGLSGHNSCTYWAKKTKTEPLTGY